MLLIQTEFGNFGHPNDLLRYMKDNGITKAHIKVLYCLTDVFEKDVSIDDASRWASNYISPVAGTLQDAVRWLRLGGIAWER